MEAAGGQRCFQMAWGFLTTPFLTETDLLVDFALFQTHYSNIPEFHHSS
jgi:hypothetical protein